MAYEIKVPSLGESIVEATVARWLKQPGEAVTAGEAVVELETDKVNLEVATDEAGVIGEIARGEGETVAIGDLLGTIVKDGEESASSARPAPATAPAPAARPAPAPEPAASPAARPAPAPEPPPATEPASASNGVASTATPTAQRVASEYHVDLSNITGTGPSGRIVKDDVLRTVGPESAPAVTAVTSAPPPAPSAKAPATPAAQQPAAKAPAPSAPAGDRPEERQRLSRRRLTIARRLVEAQHTAAMLTTFNEVDMSAVMELRKRRKDAFKERYGVNLGFMSFFTRAVIGALKAFPIVNAEMQGEEVLIKHYYDIGVAVGVEEGLVVPVVRNADRKSFAQLEREIGDLAKKAREGALSMGDLQGGTFTITNGGVYGSLMSTPILNTPQVGILGMHKIEERPVAIGGQVAIRPMMYLALSYDHRLIDGSTAVRFLVRVKELIEDPEALLLEG